jgi:hypothetical protein
MTFDKLSLSLTLLIRISTMICRSYWIPGSYAPTLSKKRNSFLKLLRNKDFKEGSMTKVGLYAIGTSTTLESNKSLICYASTPTS